MGMQGLVNTAIQGFVTATHGQARWQALLAQAGLGDLVDGDGFDSMASYDDWTTAALLAASGPVLGRSRDVLLEDLGTFLISNPALDPLRRLLRFGGVTFTDFLFSLEDLPARARMALPELVLPDLSLIEEGGGERFTLICQPGTGPLGEGFGFVMVGILRALADDYGALAVIDHLGARPSLIVTPAGAPPPMSSPPISNPQTLRPQTLRPQALRPQTLRPQNPRSQNPRSRNPHPAGAPGVERRRLPLAEAISIIVHDPAFHAGRRFLLTEEGGK